MNEVIWAVTHYGYIAMFSLLALGIVGMPIPDEALMVLAGSMTVGGSLRYIYVFLVCFLGGFVGALVSYWLGRKLGKPLLERFGSKMQLTPNRLSKVEAWFNTYGAFTIVVGYFVPGIRHFICYVAGMSRFHFMLYLGAVFVGNMLWVGTFLTIGHAVGIHWETTMMWMNTQWHLVMWSLCLLMLLTLGSIWIWRRKKKVFE